MNERQIKRRGGGMLGGPYCRDGHMGKLHESLRYCDSDERIWHGCGATPVVIDLSLLVEIDGAKLGNALRLSQSCLNKVDAHRNNSAGN